MGRPNVNWNVGIAAEKQSTYTSKAVKAGIPFASQVTEPNTKYIIKYDFDLGGETVEMPENCVLQFDGGGLKNGTLKGEGTYLDVPTNKAFENVKISGTFANEVLYTDWWQLDTSETTGDSEVISSIVASNVQNIIFGNGYYKFSNALVTTNKKIKGTNTTWLGSIKYPGQSALKSFVTVETAVSCFEVSDITIYGDIEHDSNNAYVGDGLFILRNVDSVSFDNIKFFNIRSGYPQANPNSYTFELIDCVGCKDIVIKDCEFSNINSHEWIKIMPNDVTHTFTSLEEYISNNYSTGRMNTNVKFVSNYIHGDQNRATPFLAVCNNLYIEDNIIDNCEYTGSTFNCYGFNNYFRNNTIKNSKYGSVFDTCEFGDWYAKTVYVENNIIECKNSQLLVTWAGNIYINNNVFKGFSVLSTPDMKLSAQTISTTTTYNSYVSKFRQHEKVIIKDNNFDCSYYTTDLSYQTRDLIVSPAYCSVVGIVTACNMAGSVTIEGNTIYAPYDDWFDTPHPYPPSTTNSNYIRKFLRLANVPKLRVVGNVTSGYAKVDGSSYWGEIINIANSVSYWIPDTVFYDLKIKSILIKDNTFDKVTKTGSSVMNGTRIATISTSSYYPYVVVEEAKVMDNIVDGAPILACSRGYVKRLELNFNYQFIDGSIAVYSGTYGFNSVERTALLSTNLFYHKDSDIIVPLETCSIPKFNILENVGETCLPGNTVDYSNDGTHHYVWMLAKGTASDGSQVLADNAEFRASDVPAGTVKLLGDYGSDAHKDMNKQVWVKVSERVDTYITLNS